MSAEDMLHEEFLRSCLALCAQVLRLPQHEVRVDAGFFAMGGTSMRLMQFAAMLEEEFPELFGDEGVDLALLSSAETLGDIPRLILDRPRAVSAVRLTEGEL